MARRRRSASPELSTVLARSLSRAPWWVVLLVLVALAIAGWFNRDAEVGDAPSVDPAEPGQTYLVVRAVDGDTLELAGGDRLRLLGVDTPETVHPQRPVEPFGPEAFAFTKNLVAGRRVRIGFDKERKDRYGRLLGYVYVGDTLLNEELIRAGLARAQTQYPYSAEMKRRFRAAETEAKAARRGIWSLPQEPAGAAKPRRAA